MLYRRVPKTGDELSILGYGCMRFPMRSGMAIDEERAIRQIRSAIEGGVNYFDTAPIYHLGRSEPILARALADGYRERVRVATKLPPWSVTCREDMDRILARQLATLQTDHIDYYLLHGLAGESFDRLCRQGVLEFLDAAKADGRITSAGFSFHGRYDAFRTIVDAHDWEFCQIQYNYLDEQNQAGTKGLEYAASRRLAVMVMEPLRGGNLAGRIPADVQAIWDESVAGRSPAEWGLRWVWNHPEVTVVLSGMNEEAHIAENIRVAGGAQAGSLTGDELALIARVRDTYRRLLAVGCTGCGYCMPCPFGVDIPGCFAEYNAHRMFPDDRGATFQYVGRHGGLLSDTSYAGLCTGCGRCETICPQHLPVRQLLREVSREMEGMMLAKVAVLKGLLRVQNAVETCRRRLFPRSGE
jgi:predicted aldo/keto reductase-like oxidoreductase